MNERLWGKLTINQMLFVSHLLLISVVIAGMSYSRYHSELEVRISQQVSTAKSAYTSLMTLLSGSVAGRNYANLMMPTTRSTIFGIENLLFMQVAGVSDYQQDIVSVRYLPGQDMVWRTDIEPQELSGLEATLSALLEQKLMTAEDNEIRHRKLDFLINKSIADIDSLSQSIKLAQSVSLAWPRPHLFTNGYALDTTESVLHIALELTNKNGGEIWAVVDASGLVAMRQSLLKDLLLEACVAIVISILLISAITVWIVSPLKSLARSMRQDIHQIDPAQLSVSKRNDEIGELTRAYSSLIVKIHNQLRVLQKLSDTDSLTGLASRHKYNRVAHEFILRGHQGGEFVSISLCDIDQFKSYNDTYGHIDGDNALCVVASIIEEGIGEYGEVYRFGGEEFVILAKAGSKAVLTQRLNAINQEIENAQITHSGNAPFGVVTLSIGAVLIEPSLPLTASTHFDEVMEVSIAQADRQLYQVKSEGRNQVKIEPLQHSMFSV